MADTAYGDEVPDRRTVVPLDIASKEYATLGKADGVELEKEDVHRGDQRSENSDGSHPLR